MKRPSQADSEAYKTLYDAWAILHDTRDNLPEIEEHANSSAANYRDYWREECAREN